jgi:hypothetical protein
MEGGASRARLVAGWVGVVVSAAGLAAAMVAVYLAMREVMVESGGFCAIGGPYEIANECSQEQVYLLMGGIFAALVFGVAHVAFTSWVEGPQIGPFAMIGVGFFALGWNFLDLGLGSGAGEGAIPASEDGTVVAWLICGVVFWLMAAGFVAPAVFRAIDWLRRRGAPEESAFSTPLVKAAPAPGSPDPGVAQPPTPTTPVPTRLVPPDRPPGADQ